MKRWMIVLSWWAQEFLDKPRRDHLTTDPACERYRAPREGSRLDRMSRGLECEPCMVRRAFNLSEMLCLHPATLEAVQEASRMNAANDLAWTNAEVVETPPDGGTR